MVRTREAMQLASIVSGEMWYNEMDVANIRSARC